MGMSLTWSWYYLRSLPGKYWYEADITLCPYQAGIGIAWGPYQACIGIASGHTSLVGALISGPVPVYIWRFQLGTN
jgi:hypothetical protein